MVIDLLFTGPVVRAAVSDNLPLLLKLGHDLRQRARRGGVGQ